MEKNPGLLGYTFTDASGMMWNNLRRLLLFLTVISISEKMTLCTLYQMTKSIFFCDMVRRLISSTAQTNTALSDEVWGKICGGVALRLSRKSNKLWRPVAYFRMINRQIHCITFFLAGGCTRFMALEEALDKQEWIPRVERNGGRHSYRMTCMCEGEMQNSFLCSSHERWHDWYMIRWWPFVLNTEHNCMMSPVLSTKHQSTPCSLVPVKKSDSGWCQTQLTFAPPKLCTCNLCKTTLVTRCRGTYVTTRVILGVNFQCSLASSKESKSCHSFSPADFIINPEEVTNQCELSELSKTHRHPVMHIMSVHLWPLIVITPSHFISPWLTFLFLFSIAFFCLPQSSINGKCNKS